MDVRGLCVSILLTVLPAAQGPTFRRVVDLVTLNVTVTDGSRHYVTDLERADFRVFEDGRPQELTFFHKADVPLALALLLDTSASMERNLPTAQEAAIGFVNQLAPSDIAMVVDFDSRIDIREPFTGDRLALERAIRRSKAGGATALYNAVYIALKELNKTISDEPLTAPRRRAVVILSDGEDTSSLVSFDEVLDLAARSDTAIFCIGLLDRDPDENRGSKAQFVLRRLAEQTGGRTFFSLDVKELAAIYGEITAELSNQYFLAYESTNTRRDGQFRRIAVRVQRPGAIARTRPGYYAPRR
jgi:Ca-activated chloride channel homolog